MINIQELRETVRFALVSTRIPWFRWEDVEQDVWLAVVKARTRFDESRGVHFRVFVQRWARGAALDSMRRNDYATRDHRELIKRGECPNITHGPLDTARLLPSESKPLEAVAIEADLVDKALSVLDGRRRYIVEQMLMHDRTQSELAEELSVTEGRIGQIKRAGLKKMRSHMSATA